MAGERWLVGGAPLSRPSLLGDKPSVQTQGCAGNTRRGDWFPAAFERRA
jgi:hypothetical protein